MSELKYCPECGNKMDKSSRFCEQCGYDTMEGMEITKQDRSVTSTYPTTSREPSTWQAREGAHPNWSSMESFVSTLGSLAWIIGVINAILYFILGIYDIIVGAYYSSFSLIFSGIWQIIGGVIVLITSVQFVKSRFSEPCSRKDWEYLYKDVLIIENIKIPWMLIWGILLELFGRWWGGIAVLIPAFILLFIGPRTYNWKINRTD